MKPWLLVASAALVLLVVANRRRDLLALAGSSSAPVELDAANAEQGQGDWTFNWDLSPYLSAVDPASYLPSMNSPATEAANVQAFLQMIRFAEGTAGPNGYRTMFGGRLFSNDYVDHPREPAQFTDRAGRTLWTSAAGAYQFMAISQLPNGTFTKVNTWDRLQEKLGLPDFSPASQDRAAVELISEQGALNDVKAGRFATAVDKVRSVWASMPGAGYAQPERTLAALESQYQAAGGTLS